VDIEDIYKAIREEEIFVYEPEFYERAFSFVSKQQKKALSREADNFRRVAVEDYDELSKRLDLTKFQESCAVRNVLKTRRLANLLVDDKGELNLSVLPRLISHVETYLHSIGPNRQYDSKRQKHLLKVLQQLNENKELARLIKSITKPMSHRYAEQIIRDTLLLPSNIPITDAHTRRAVLSAWMCTLRQNIGSCFATAPAIIIHDELPEMFFTDIRELLSTGRLKRTFGGIEYSVPLSQSWGAGDLKKPFYLPLGSHLFEESRIWMSPGLAAAFQSAGLLDAELSATETLEKVKAIILDVIHSLEWNQPFILITAEEIIRKAILRKFGLSEQDVQDYENRPKEMLQSGLLLQVARPGLGGAGKAELCKNFLADFAVACNALKGLADNALLKAWEFSLASFAETKAQFTRWNLYASLGLGAQEKGGIGERLYEMIKRELEQANKRVQDFQYEYENVFHQLKTMETRMRSISSEKEAQWFRAEYQTKRNEFYTLEDMRDEIHKKAQRFANLYDVLIDQYDVLFPLYFQEVYDADMFDISAGPYDDSPAGFRLLYKYGRSNTSQWSRIKTPSEFIESLVSFFTATETEIAASQQMEGLQTEFSEIVTAIVNQVRTKEFLESAFYRMAAAHQTPIVRDPLNHLEQIEKKPWAYTSGGTMSTLVSCYYRLETKPMEVSRWVESSTELLIFLVDTLKQIPPKLIEDYLHDPDKAMLMHSPTHAFLLKPGLSPFKEAWQTDAFTYTWVRDNIILPRERFVDSLWLDAEKMHYLIERFAAFVPENYRHYFLRVFGTLYGTMRPGEFRDHIIDTISKERGLKQVGRSILNENEIDSSLYSLLPLFHRSELKERLENLYDAIPELSPEYRQIFFDIFEAASQSYTQATMMDADALQRIFKGLLSMTLQTTASNVDYHTIVSHAAQKLGYAMPAPIIFADTNWVKEEFGFVLNPGSGRFELWRIDATGRIGHPMTIWEQWLNGSRKDITWGIYTKPYEYSTGFERGMLLMRR